MKPKKILCFILLLIVLNLSGCIVPDNNTTTKKYKVTYTSDSDVIGEAPVSIEVASGTEIILPLNPFIKEGYSFTGWSDGNKVYEESGKYTVLSNIIFKAQWQKLKELTISFNSDDGNTINPIKINEGNKLSFSDIPLANKDGFIFVDWYLDSELTNPFDCVTHVFKEDTILYAKYQEVFQTITNSTIQEETSLTNQALDQTFIVIGQEELNDSNVADKVTITAESSDYLIPKLSVKKLKDGVFELIPNGNYTEQGSYTITLESPFTFEVEMDNEKFQFKQINFRIASADKEVIVTKDSIINIKVTDYYALYDNLLYLHKDFVLENSLLATQIIAIEINDGTIKYAKIASLSNHKIFHQTQNKEIDCILVEVEACELTDVFLDLDVYQEKEISETEIELNDQKKLIREIKDNPEMNRFIELSTFAVVDYVNRNKLSVVNNITIPIPEISINVKKDANGGVTANINTSFRIKIDDNLYADVVVNATEYIYINTIGDGKVKSNLSWNFGIEATARTVTNLKFEVVLYHNGQKYDIREKINEEINHPDVDSFVANYKKNLAMDTDEIELFSVRLFRAKFPLAYIFEIGIPVDFNLSFDLNAAFSSDILYSVTKTYGLKGSNKNGIETYTKDVLTTYEYSFYYSGCIGFKAGVSLSLEVGVANFSYLGVAGLAIEVGAYFDFYGYGSYSVIDRSSNDNINAYIKTTGGYAYDFGIYLDLEVYVESSAFFVKKDHDLLSKKLSLLSGGESAIAVDYQDSIYDKRIIMQGNEINYLNLDLFGLVFMDLKTGKTVSRDGDLDKFLLFFNDPAFYYDSDKGIIGIKEYFLKGNSRRPDLGGRIDTQLIIKYWGPNISTSTGYLEIEIPFSYIPLNLDIPIEDLNKTFTVTFKINDEVYETNEILIGTIPVAPKVNQSWYEQNLNVSLVKWDNISEPVMEDKEYQATIKRKYSIVEFEYYLHQEENELVGSYVEKLYCYAGDLPIDLVESLEYFSPTNTTGYKFIGWSENINTPVSHIYDYKNPVRYVAQYEKVPFEIVLDVEPVVNNVGKQILGRQIYKTIAYYGDIPNIEYETIPGYSLRFTTTNITYTSMPRVFGNTTIHAEYVPNKYYTVEVLNSPDGYTLAVEYFVEYGSDVTYILQNEKVVNYTPKYTRPLPVNLINVFVGWFPDPSVLEFVTDNITIIPIFELVEIRYHYTFDPGIGEIPSHMDFLETAGIDVIKGSGLSAEFVKNITPTVPSTESIEYTFINWLEKDEYGNLTPFDFSNPPERDVNLVAQYESKEKLYSFEFNANGHVYKKVDGNYQNIVVDTSFNDGSEVYKVENMNLEEKNNYIEKIRKQEINLPDLIINDTTLQFYYWRMIEYDKVIKCYPMYREKTVNTGVEIILNAGLGKFDNESNILILNDEVSNDNSVIYYPSILPMPLLNTKISNFDENGKNYHTIDCAYSDDNYYYLPLAWSYDGITPLPMDHEIVLNASKRTVNLYLIYNQIPRFQEIDFLINVGTEKYLDGLGGAWRSYARIFGTPLTEDMIPEVIKPLPIYEQCYENIFIGWMNQETGEIGVTDTFNKSRIVYVPVFEKRLKEITITLNAGENGTFPSTGTSKKEYVISAGSTIKEFEIPIYTSDSEFYNVYFDRWSQRPPYISGFTDFEIEAYTKKVRNQNPTAEIGIIANFNGMNEDISISSIEGYEYDIDEKTLLVYGPGFTFTGINQQNDIKLIVYCEEVTLKNLNITDLAVNPGITDFIKINIDGTVNINTTTDDSYDVYSIFTFVDVLTIKGISENAELIINYKTTNEKESDYESLLVFARSITTEDLDFTINLDVPSNFRAYIIRIEYGCVLSLIRSNYKIQVLGEMNNNIYAISLQEEAKLIKDNESKIEIINCLEIYQDQEYVPLT